MKKRGRIAVAFLIAASLYGYAPLAEAQAPLRCGPFMQGELSPPTPRQNGHARALFYHFQRPSQIDDRMVEGQRHSRANSFRAPQEGLLPGKAFPQSITAVIGPRTH